MDRHHEIIRFGKNLCALREEHCLTPDEMAKRLGVSEKTLLAIENGQLPPRLSCSILFRIQRKFGVSPKDLFS